MRGDPNQIDKATSEQSRLTRDKHREPDGWERDARAEAKADAEARERADSLKADLLRIARMEFGITDEESRAFKAGLDIGRQDERNRIVAGLDALLRETAAIWFEGTGPTKAVAAYTARVRAIVEGRT